MSEALKEATEEVMRWKGMGSVSDLERMHLIENCARIAEDYFSQGVYATSTKAIVGDAIAREIRKQQKEILAKSVRVAHPTPESGHERVKNLANKCTCVERKYSSLIPECTLSDEEHEILEKAAHGISALPRSGVEEAVKELYKVHYSRELKLPLEDWIVERDSAIIHRHLALTPNPM